MKQEIKQLWVEALRSGEYIQGKKFLNVIGHGENNFCCLGVLCDIYQKQEDTVKLVTGVSNLYGVEKVVYFETSPNRTIDSVLPEAVWEWAGLKDCSPIDSEQRFLWEYNDILDKSFTEIADIIEKDL